MTHGIFVDTALRRIENAEYLGDLRVIKEEGITFGPVAEQDAVPDFTRTGLRGLSSPSRRR